MTFNDCLKEEPQLLAARNQLNLENVERIEGKEITIGKNKVFRYFYTMTNGKIWEIPVIVHKEIKELTREDQSIREVIITKKGTGREGTRYRVDKA